MLRNTDEDVAQNYMASLINPLYHDVNFDDGNDDSHLLIRLRVDAITWACKYGNADCITQSKTKYAAWMEGPEENEYLIPRKCNLFRTYLL